MTMKINFVEKTCSYMIMNNNNALMEICQLQLHNYSLTDIQNFGFEVYTQQEPQYIAEAVGK